MKPRMIPASLLLAVALVLSPGCSSIPLEDQTREMATIAEVAAYTGARYDLLEHPGHRVFFEASLAALDSLVRDEDYDPQKFAAALQGLPIKELRDDQGALLVGSAVILWDAYAARVINLDKTKFVQPVIAAVQRGLRRALQ
jgi:hypothetical protein